MIIVCDHCETRFRLPDDQIRRDVFKARCFRCGNIFTVHRKPPQGKPVELGGHHVLGDGRRIFTVCNQKGGVAKTSTCINLGAAYAVGGRKVLLIDFDVQANLTELLKCSGERCFFDVMESGGVDDLPKSILKVGENLWVLPSNARMALFSKKYMNTKGFERILADWLNKVADFFDVVLIDTPPSLDFFTINALMASRFAIIPTQAEFLAAKGVGHVENIIDVLRGKTGHSLDYKVLITMFNDANTASRAMRDSLRQRLGEQHVFDTLVEWDPKIQESQIVGASVLQYAPDCAASLQYRALARELDGISLAG